MSGQLLLIGNPARRKSRKPRSAAQKAATRRMLAANRRTRKNPISPSVSNPKRRRRAARRNPISASNPRRRARRNPISSGVLRGLKGTLTNAAFGAAGAIGVDVAYGFAIPYLPAAVATPVDAAGGINYAYYAAKAAAALGIGFLAQKMLGASKAGHVINGSLTVTMHDAMKQFIAGNMGGSVTLGVMPGGLPVGGRIPGMGVYISGQGRRSGMGAYLPNANAGASGMNAVSGTTMRERETSARF